MPCSLQIHYKFAELYEMLSRKERVWLDEVRISTILVFGSFGGPSCLPVGDFSAHLFKALSWPSSFASSQTMLSLQLWVHLEHCTAITGCHFQHWSRSKE